MTPLRRWLGLGLCALTVVSSGCNLLSLPFFLMGPDPSVPPTMQKLATENKDQTVRVAVLASSNLPVSDQLARVDRELSARVVKHLGELCKHNKENVEVVPVNVVERYKNKHPDWDHPLDLLQIGKDLKVKYVVYLEINSLSLYVPKSNNEFYQGETDVKVTLVNTKKAADELPEYDDCHETYPSTPITAFDEKSPVAFRSKFLDHVAEKIAWKFTSHPTDKDYAAE
jgi:hypothetical protein